MAAVIRRSSAGLRGCRAASTFSPALLLAASLGVRAGCAAWVEREIHPVGQKFSGKSSPANFPVTSGRFCYGKNVASFGSSLKELDVNRSTLVLAGLLWLGFQATGFAQWGNHQHTPWRVEFGAAIMDRPGDINNTAPVLLDRITGDTLINGEQISDPGTGAGPDLSIQYFPNIGNFTYELRGRYYGWRDQTQDRGLMQLTGAEQLNFEVFETDYVADYISLEFNAKRTVRPGLNLIGGARFINMEERLFFRGDGFVDLPPPFGSVPFENDVNIRASNPMIGLQTGLDWGVQLSNRVMVNSFLRAGGYSNFAKQRTRLTNSLLFTDTTTTTDQSQLAFAGETGFRVHVEIFERHLFGYVGGEAHFLNRIATAPAQLELEETGFQGINTVAPRFYGITFGLDARF